MANQRIRVGLVGASASRGWGNQAHIPALHALPEYELTAVCTAHRETAEAAARTFGAPRAYRDYRRLVEDAQIDLVAVAVRSPWHREMVLAALAAGKHVFCEWPLAVNLAEAEEMAAAARASGVLHMVGLQGRVAPWAMRLKELVEEGYLGRVLTINARMFMPDYRRRPELSWMARRERGNHILTIQVGHQLDLIRHCLGEFVEVSAEVRTQVPQWHFQDTGETVEADAPDAVAVQGMLASGALVSAHIAYVPYHGGGWRLEVFGHQGAIVASSPSVGHVLPNRLEGARQGEEGFRELPVPARLIWAPEAASLGAAFHVAQMYRRLAQGIRDGQPVEPSFETALDLHRLLARLEHAAQEGRRLNLSSL